MVDTDKPCPFCGQDPRRNDIYGAEPYLTCTNMQCCAAWAHFARDRWNSRPGEDDALERAAKAIDAEAEKCREVGVRIADGPRSGHWQALGNTAALRAYERAAAIVRGSKGQS
jgi:hypothetical protein